MKPPLSDTLRTVDQSGSGRGSGPGRPDTSILPIGARAAESLVIRPPRSRICFSVAEPVYKLLGKGVRVRQRGRQPAHAFVREAGEAPAEGEHGAKSFAIDNLRVEYRGAKLGELRLDEPLCLWAKRRAGLREHDGVGNRPARDPFLHLDHADLLGRQFGVELRSLDRDHDEL